MSLDKINKSLVSDFYDHRNRYIIGDIDKLISFYRLGDKGEQENLDLLRVNFLLSSKNLSADDIFVVEKNILIKEKYDCGSGVFGYNGIEVDLFGNTINKNYTNTVPNVNPKRKIFPAVYYRWKEHSKNKIINDSYVDIRYLLGVLNTNYTVFKETIDLFKKENLLFKLN